MRVQASCCASAGGSGNPMCSRVATACGATGAGRRSGTRARGERGGTQGRCRPHLPSQPSPPCLPLAAATSGTHRLPGVEKAVPCCLVHKQLRAAARSSDAVGKLLAGLRWRQAWWDGRWQVRTRKKEGKAGGSTSTAKGWRDRLIAQEALAAVPLLSARDTLHTAVHPSPCHPPTLPPPPHTSGSEKPL